MTHPISNTATATADRIGLDAHVAPAPDLLYSELDGEGVVLDLSSGVYFGLNPVGARVWQLLDGGRPLREVRDALLTEFDVEPARCEADLLEVVGRMAKSGLVRVA